MPVRIRLARYGHRNLPFIASTSRTRAHPATGSIESSGTTIRNLVRVRGDPPTQHSRPASTSPLADPRHPSPSVAAEIDGNKHMGLKIDRAKCVRARATASDVPPAI